MWRGYSSLENLWAMSSNKGTAYKKGSHQPNHVQNCPNLTKTATGNQGLSHHNTMTWCLSPQTLDSVDLCTQLEARQYSSILLCFPPCRSPSV